MDSQWSKQEACFALATQVWLAVNHNTSITSVEWVQCSKHIACASQLVSCQSNMCNSWGYEWLVLFVCFVALRPGQQLWSLWDGQFLGKLEQAVNQYFVHILSLVTDNYPSWMIHSVEGRRMTVQIISWSISTKVWERARFQRLENLKIH